MINWFQLLTNSIWISALALAFAVVGYTRWDTKLGKGRFRDLLNRSPRAILINLAGLLFCLGLALTDHAWWERLLWGILMVLFGIKIYLGSGASRRKTGDGRRNGIVTRRLGEKETGREKKRSFPTEL